MATKNVNTTAPNILRLAGEVQTDNGLLWTPPVYTHRTGRSDSASSGSSSSNQNHGMLIRSFSLQNAATAGAVGIGWRFVNHSWEAGRYDGTTYTRVADLQSRTAAAIQTTGANQDGLLILCREKPMWVSVNISTAETNAGGSTVVDHAVNYSAAAGAWTAYTSGSFADDFTLTDTVWSATIKQFVWIPPAAFVKTDSHTGVPVGFYGLHFTSAQREASDVAAVATGIECGAFAAFLISLAQNGVYEEDPIGIENAYYSQYGNGLIAYFDTANAQNIVSAAVESA